MIGQRVFLVLWQHVGPSLLLVEAFTENGTNNCLTVTYDPDIDTKSNTFPPCMPKSCVPFCMDVVCSGENAIYDDKMV